MTLVRTLLSLTLSLILLTGTPALAAKVTVMHGWPAQQGETFGQIVRAFEDKNKGIDVVVEIVGRDRPAVLATRLAAGNPPDLMPHPWLGLQTTWARQGKIKPLGGKVDPSALLDALRPLGEVDGKLYGLFVFPNLKSLVWYNKKAFTERGYEIPTSWDEMLALSDRIAADGAVPWSIGLESGSASGWPGTDWIEDIMLRTAGPDLYDQWVRHEIPWTHPAVKNAFEQFGRIALDPRLTLGGATGALTTNFGDAPSALFTSPPQAYMHRQGTFIQGFIQQQNPGLKPGVGFDAFIFPPIEAEAGQGTPALIAGDIINCFSDRPEVIAFAQFLISMEAQEIWVTSLGELSSNRGTDTNLYTNPITRRAWEILAGAEVLRYDGSDLMPAAVGTGAFWSGVLDYVSGVPLDTVLETIEETAVDAYDF